MENQNEQQKKRRAPTVVAQNEGNQTERVGMWIGLGAAAAATVGVLALAFYTDYQANNKPEAAQEVIVIEETVSVVPASQAEAERIALASSEAQSQGMDAPAEVVSEPVATVAPETVASTPAQVILAENNIDADEAKVIVGNGIVKFYFASGKSELADNVIRSLKDVVNGVKAGKKAVVSGFADNTGDVALNERLSKERAFKVRDALLAAGIPESSIEMKKPQNTTGSGAKDEARRVEVVLQ
ncbi:OmpA family protein [Neisseriaceae bacterium B1]